MAQHDTDLTPPAPALVAPREQAVIDGRSVTFEWEPVEMATEYLLEVASDTAFEHVVYSEHLSGATTHTVVDTFTTDGETYFWRVLAKGAGVWSNGDHVESFICCTDEATLAAHMARPEEELGPYPALISSAAQEARAELTGDPEAFAAEGEGVEHEGIEAGQIMGIALAILVSVALAIVAVYQLTQIGHQQTFTAALNAADYPDLREERAEAALLMTQYGIVDEEAGVYRIPVERAMALLANQTYQQPRADYSDELQLLPEEAPARPEAQPLPGEGLSPQ